MTDRYATGNAYWRDPVEEPAPRATKVLLLNPSGVAVIGHWAHWAIAWAPLPKIPRHIKDKMYPPLEAK
jgi:hypothetical protein